MIRVNTDKKRTETEQIRTKPFVRTLVDNLWIRTSRTSRTDKEIK